MSDAGPRHPFLGVSGRVAAGWLAGVALTTLFLWAFRPALDTSHLAMAYLLLVLGGSARHGGRLGLALAVLCFLCFNFFLLPPFYTLVIADPLDWVVLAAFLVTSSVAAHLLERARREASAANQRAEEIDRLSMLGAESLNAGRAEEAVQAIARVLQSTLRVAVCEIHLWESDANLARLIAREVSRLPAPVGATDGLLAYVVEQGAAALERAGGTSHVFGEARTSVGAVLAGSGEATVVLLPLKVRGRAVGVLRLADHQPICLDPAQVRFAETLAYYAALGVERVRLVAEEERAEALRQADRVKDALLASVSHDLRTPLTTIKALAREMSEAGDDRALAIEEEADRLNRLVADLLDMSSLDAGALPVVPEIVAAEDLVGAALRRVSGMPAAREITVTLPGNEVIALGRFDFSHSLRVLVNLLENALKYGPSGEHVDLCVQQDDEWLRFVVMDRGPGVPPEEAERIFQPFHRGSGAQPDARGTGLGLAIARRLAASQGGSVTYRPRPGGGSVFTYQVPAVRLHEAITSS